MTGARDVRQEEAGRSSRWLDSDRKIPGEFEGAAVARKAAWKASRSSHQRARESLRHLWFKAFLLFERFGLHVLPTHYGSPIADFHWLQRNKTAWTSRVPLTGVHWDLDQQLRWLKATCTSYLPEVAGLTFFEENCRCHWGPGFGPIESQVLHCFIRDKTPARVIEIGSGLSTVCMLHACQLNVKEGRPNSTISCIDPYSRNSLQHNTRIRIVRAPLQVISCSIVAQLQTGDLLFIDSSHAVKVGSDVIRIYLEIIPSLPPGVFIHVHDIFLPYLYNRSVLSNYFYTNSQETMLLLALLMENKHLSVLAALSALHYDRQTQLMNLFPDYDPEANCEGLSPSFPRQGHFPCSIWMKTC